MIMLIVGAGRIIGCIAIHVDLIDSIRRICVQSSAFGSRVLYSCPCDIDRRQYFTMHITDCWPDMVVS
jgi:hypothetical protein